MICCSINDVQRVGEEVMSRLQSTMKQPNWLRLQAATRVNEETNLLDAQLKSATKLTSRREKIT